MPKGPDDEERPAGLIGNAAKVRKIATSNKQEEFEGKDGRVPAAQAMDRKAD